MNGSDYIRRKSNSNFGFYRRSQAKLFGACEAKDGSCVIAFACKL